MAPRVLTTSCSTMPRAASSASPEFRGDRAGALAWDPVGRPKGFPLPPFPSSPLELYLFLEGLSEYV